MDSGSAHFWQTDTNVFMPTDHAEVQSRWAEDHVVGAAITGLAALTLDTAFGLPDFTPARLTVDLFKSPRRVPTTTTVDLVRDGRRVRNSVCTMKQEGVAVARAVLVQYRRSAAPDGHEWTPTEEKLEAPSLNGLTAQNGAVRQLQSGGVGWTSEIADHQNAARKRVVIRSVDIVAGQPNTPFVQAAAAAEATSLVTNLGTAGVGYINGDLTVALTRLPRSDWICVHADTHWASDGISVGTATLVDDSGAFGSGLVTALSNRHAQIDFAEAPPG
ncbi:acyl-CoA thioesterase domain-containing protein [Mycobacterium sp. E796]|uniref:acyl-CoA thioesterase domain-containing protein n=1 Tax=Mycobacterium sp. E796 TaxID=1834151 RepID=UPI00080078AD|nr:acyl-CoA thioesterase domain-containing protein [Mycobacterium sp. E796]OBI44053.1 thioesterase [Mycobacterium sp. E796]